jgi:arylsulfatase A-like enzyme
MLRERGLSDSSLIILTGDHGSRMMRAEAKCCVHGAGHYEENLRVPFILELPAGGEAGRRQELVRHIDILPTVLDVVGLPAAPTTARALRYFPDWLRGLGPSPFSPYSEDDGRCWPRRGVVDERYKYIYTPSGPMDQILIKSPLFFDDECSSHPPCTEVAREELYDLSTDPFEERDLLKAPLDQEASGNACGSLRQRT